MIAGARTLVFVRSRRGAELTALAAKRHLIEAGAAELADRVAAYRGGYLAQERRALERALASGELLGVATTNALELGVDITGLDAVVLAGYPGTLASLWQQAGRAGRRGQDALVVFIARDDPLDTYLVNNPAAIFARPVEASVTDPGNPHVLGPQLCCAAAELALTSRRRRAVRRPGGRAGAGRAGRAGAAAPAPGRLVLDRPQPAEREPARRRPAGHGGGVGLGLAAGHRRRATAPATVHPAAVYLHQGSSFVVEELDLEHGAALVRAEDPPWTTCAQEITDIAILATEQSALLDGVERRDSARSRSPTRSSASSAAGSAASCWTRPRWTCRCSGWSPRPSGTPWTRPPSPRPDWTSRTSRRPARRRARRHRVAAAVRQL